MTEPSGSLLRARRPRSEQTQRRRGHAFLEALVILILLSIVMAAVHSVLLSQSRFHRLQARIASARDAARIALDVLAGELRPLSPAAGDVYGIGRDSVAFRSISGVASICSASETTLTLRRITGTFGDLAADSVSVFVEGDVDTLLDDTWRVAAILDVRASGSGRCPDGRLPDLRLTLDRELSGVGVGSPVRAFRPYVYKLYRASEGSWWLGQRLRQGRLQPVTGPFAPPGEGGLLLEYSTRTGAPSGTGAEVTRVRVSVKAIGDRALRLPGQEALADTLSTVVYLRNS